MSKIITVDKLPKTLEELRKMSVYDRSKKENIVVMTILAFCIYNDDPDICVEILNDLRGERKLLETDKQFIKERFADKKYLIYSYFEGAKPENNYKPKPPYRIKINEGDCFEKNHANIYVYSEGADAPRLVKLINDVEKNEWYLWEQYLLSDIRLPKSE